jgi:hypothetical protein
MDLGPVAPIVLLATALYSFVNLVKYVRAGKAGLNGVATLVGAWVAGVGAIALCAHSDATAHLRLIEGGQTLGALDGGSQVLVGAVFGGVAAGIADFRKAFDNNDDATKPPLVG